MQNLQLPLFSIHKNSLDGLEILLDRQRKTSAKFFAALDAIKKRAEKEFSAVEAEIELRIEEEMRGAV